MAVWHFLRWLVGAAGSCLTPFLSVLLLALALTPALRHVLILWRKPSATRVAFFHPFTNDGGGGERVLWCSVRALQQSSLQRTRGSGGGAETTEWVVYTGDEASTESLEERARRIFGVDLPLQLKVVRLRFRKLVEAATWPHLTLMGQSLGSMVLAAEAVLRCPPSIFIDTAGYAFSYPVAKALAGCHVAAYTHYPTISTDMLQRVRQRSSLYNNSERVAKSPFLSSLKLLYYRVFALAYGAAGFCADVVMVNSSWTEAHIRSLWRWNPHSSICRVYPPCDTKKLQEFPLEGRDGQERCIVSVAQFRPEKNHALQLRAFARAVEEERSMQGVRLKLVGGSRNKEDEGRVEMLGSLAVQLGIEGKVDFCVNVPFSELQLLLRRAKCGLHTMLDEHFGIGIVEYMAAGAVAIAHNSGGPQADILQPAEDSEGRALPVGFLAMSVEEYATAIRHAFSMPHEEYAALANRARERARAYSEERFTACVTHVLEPFL